jgi:hypothetical protein
MRRLAFVCLPLCVLALPAAAFAYSATATDGTLVVQNGTGPAKTAVVTIVITGTVIGHVSSGSPDQNDTVIVEDVDNTGNVAASASLGNYLTKTTAADTNPNFPSTATRTKLVGSDFRFRAPDGVYKVTIYGSGVDLFAVGQGRVMLQGQADPTVSDGLYSINGRDFRSLPAQASDWLQIASSG